MCKIRSKLTIKTPEWRQWRRSGVFIVNFEHISYIFHFFLLLTLSKYMTAGYKLNSFKKYHCLVFQPQYSEMFFLKTIQDWYIWLLWGKITTQLTPILLFTNIRHYYWCQYTVVFMRKQLYPITGKNSIPAGRNIFKIKSLTSEAATGGVL